MLSAFRFEEAELELSLYICIYMFMLVRRRFTRSVKGIYLALFIYLQDVAGVEMYWGRGTKPRICGCVVLVRLRRHLLMS